MLDAVHTFSSIKNKVNSQIIFLYVEVIFMDEKTCIISNSEQLGQCILL